ncbi:hypothetical protein M0R45_000529 [Rubus argutus]|uniref:Uncharacterized protein n=1 Tax=Rubus argutus TaxID=59490 RepID=A0AAW1VLN0_RUBAR
MANEFFTNNPVARLIGNFQNSIPLSSMKCGEMEEAGIMVASPEPINSGFLVPYLLLNAPQIIKSICDFLPSNTIRIHQILIQFNQIISYKVSILRKAKTAPFGKISLAR